MTFKLGIIKYPYDTDDVEGFAKFFGCPASTEETPIDYEQWCQDYVVKQVANILKAYNASKIDAEKRQEAEVAIEALNNSILAAIVLETQPME